MVAPVSISGLRSGAWTVTSSEHQLLRLARTLDGLPSWARADAGLEATTSEWVLEAGVMARTAGPPDVRRDQPLGAPDWHFGTAGRKVGLELRAAAASDGVVDLEISSTGGEGVGLRMSSKPWERYFGLGERYANLELSGSIVDTWVTNCAAGNVGYKVVPVLYSNSYYGLVVQDPVKMTFAVRHQTYGDVVAVQSRASCLRLWLLLGESYRDLFRRFSDRAGRPQQVGLWAFGSWRGGDWRYERQKTVTEELATAKRRHVRYSVKIIDAGWEDEQRRLHVDSEKYPAWREMVLEAEAGGTKIGVWLTPWVLADSAAHAALARQGFLVQTSDGRPYVHRLSNDPADIGSLVDFTNAGAVAWWQQEIRGLIGSGVSVFKVDFGEELPGDSRLSDGRHGWEAHNEYPKLYSQATVGVVLDLLGENGTTFGRAGGLGSQSHGAFWAGDQSSDLNPWTGLGSVILAAQTAGISGLALWSCDIGGYFGTPTPECYVRWAQFAAATPIMQFHGLGPRNPWEFGKAAERIVKRYMALHDHLSLYSYALAREASGSGYPAVRALALEFPDDAEVFDEGSQWQFLYGPDLLVAPVHWESATRFVVFPTGEWVDFWTGERVHGPTRRAVATSLEVLPLWVRAGAVLPTTSSRAGRRAGLYALSLEFYPGPARSESWLLPDGIRVDVRTGDDGGRIVQLQGAGEVSLRLRGKHCRLSRLNGKRISSSGRTLSLELSERPELLVEVEDAYTQA